MLLQMSEKYMSENRTLLAFFNDKCTRPPAKWLNSMKGIFFAHHSKIEHQKAHFAAITDIQDRSIIGERRAYRYYYCRCGNVSTLQGAARVSFLQVRQIHYLIAQRFTDVYLLGYLD